MKSIIFLMITSGLLPMALLSQSQPESKSQLLNKQLIGTWHYIDSTAMYTHYESFIFSVDSAHFVIGKKIALGTWTTTNNILKIVYTDNSNLAGTLEAPIAIDNNILHSWIVGRKDAIESKFVKIQD